MFLKEINGNTGAMNIFMTQLQKSGRMASGSYSKSKRSDLTRSFNGTSSNFMSKR